VLNGSSLRALITGETAAADSATHASVAYRLGAAALRGPLQRLVHPRLLRPLSQAWMPLGRRVAVIGGDLAAVELAEFLATRRRSVSLLESGDQLAPEIGPKRRAEHMDRLDRLGVAVNTGVSVERIERAAVRIQADRGRSALVAADSVIVAGEVTADTTLYDALEDCVAERHAVGDCTGLGLIRKAVEEGARAACAI
jgi:2,4-dienoyl-CoA reductase (NADPH2)